MKNHILENLENDGVDRRGFLKCMAWAGTGVLWTVSGGVLGVTNVNYTEGKHMLAVVDSTLG